MSKKLFWVGGAVGALTNALSLVKLANHFLNIGFEGIPKFIIDSYTSFVADLKYWLIEFPFNIHLSDLTVHLFIVWALFVGSNYRFLTYKGIGANEGIGGRLYTGLGDVGRGENSARPSGLIMFLNLLLSFTGPLFFVFVLTMWVCNRPGPSGSGGLRDFLMIGNRSYSRRLSRIYMFILLLSPALAAVLLVWGAAGSLA
uniref:hypothetical protein n=1 Tax=Marinobacterium profundum TaxID=1714300 RepID=UPI00082CCC2B|nr:hypothetical protein [Marinobacterium profundum]